METEILVARATGLRMAQPALEDVIEAFLRLELAGKSDQTKVWYRNRLKAFAGALGPGRLLVDVQEVDVLEWNASLDDVRQMYGGESSRPEKTGRLSPYTKRGHVRAVKRLCKWLLRKGLSTVDLADDVALPRLPKRGRAGIGEANVRAILQAAKGNARDYALLRFLEATGCRRGGIANLLLSDLNMDSPDNRLRRRATVREKFDKSRTVIMTPNALIALEAWLLERPAIPDEHVFLGRENGEDWHPLAPDGVSEIVDRYKERLELVGPCSPHQWRHRFCRKRAQEKMSLGQISQLAGHDDPSITVKFYGEFTVDELQDSYDDIVEDLEI